MLYFTTESDFDGALIETSSPCSTCTPTSAFLDSSRSFSDLYCRGGAVLTIAAVFGLVDIAADAGFAGSNAGESKVEALLS